MNYPFGPPQLAPNNALAPVIHASVVRPGVQAFNDWRMAMGRPMGDWRYPQQQPLDQRPLPFGGPMSRRFY